MKYPRIIEYVLNQNLDQNNVQEEHSRLLHITMQDVRIFRADNFGQMVGWNTHKLRKKGLYYEFRKPRTTPRYSAV